MAILGDTKVVSLTLLDGVIGNLLPKTTNIYNLGSSSLKWANVYATTFNGDLNGNAATASKLTAITSTDAASSSDTWRRLWISYSNNTEGRPAYTDSLVYQTSTNTLKTPHLLIEHTSGGQAEIQIKYSSTIDYWWGVGTANENHGLYDNKVNKWILSAGANNKWSFDGNATSATKANVTTTQYAIARYSATDGTFADSTATINDTGTMTIKGKLRVNPSYDTSNSYNEGIRINQASNGWANIHFGGAADSTSGNAAEAWLVGRRGAAGTYGAIGDFTIEENGSSGLGLTLHKSKGGATLYTSKAGSTTCFKIVNAGTVASTTWLYGLEILSASMAANSNATISIGQAASSKNRAYLGFHYAGSSSDNNWLELGLYGINEVFKIYGNKQVEITTDTDASNTTTGALKIAGGVGIAKKLYVGTEIHSSKYFVDDHVRLEYNSTDNSLDFVFV